MEREKTNTTKDNKAQKQPATPQWTRKVVDKLLIIHAHVGPINKCSTFFHKLVNHEDFIPIASQASNISLREVP